MLRGGAVFFYFHKNIQSNTVAGLNWLIIIRHVQRGYYAAETYAPISLYTRYHNWIYNGLLGSYNSESLSFY